MKMLAFMLLFVTCWTPATIWTGWVILRLPGYTDPRLDIAAVIGAVTAGVVPPLVSAYEE